jgi:hypothetical protein
MVVDCATVETMLPHDDRQAPERPVIVTGAGICGLATAYELV